MHTVEAGKRLSYDYDVNMHVRFNFIEIYM